MDCGIVASLKQIYKAETAEIAKAHLEDFDASHGDANTIAQPNRSHRIPDTAPEVLLS